MKGYAGRILRIDLSRGKTRVTPLWESIARSFLGGIGLGTRLLMEFSKPGIDPLTPDNPLIISTGPLCGTMAPTGGSGHVFVSKSPLTEGLGLSKSRGFFGSEVKRAGYDAVVVEKRAEKPVYILIDDGDVQLVGAMHLWGRSPQETEEIIREDQGDPGMSVAAIGLAGEKLTRFACVINDRTRAAGRTGMGAVMGSKNLKALAVRGSGDVSVAKPVEFMEFTRVLHERMRGPATTKYRTTGSTMNLRVLNSHGALPTRNFTGAVFEGAEKVSGERLNEHFVAKIVGCLSCAMPCEHIAVVSQGKHRGSVARVEYGSLWAFGPNCGVDSLEAIIKAVDLCNQYGLDTVSTGGAVGFAMDCYEHGVLSKEDTGELSLRFGNTDAVVEMVERIGRREGLGDVLAEGVKRAAKKIGGGAEKYANHIKGLEMTGYDVRGLKTAAIGFAVSLRGADHNSHCAHVLDLKGRVDRFKFEEGRSRIIVELEDLNAVIDSLILCRFSRGTYFKGFEDLSRYYTLTTGVEISGEELRKIGERINNLGRLFNIREGFTRDDDSLPVKVMKTPIPDDTVSRGSRVTEEELSLILDDYYFHREWTREGVPTVEKLKELNLESMAHVVKDRLKMEA